jgi:AcrR family transcriptional regulator
VPTSTATDDSPVRGRILAAAFSAFTEAGYARTSTLEIARRARVSKRELYSLVGTKQELLAACIRERAHRLQAPADLPNPRDRDALERSLVGLGTHLLGETTDPVVVAVHRLAIAEAVRAPEVALTLDTVGRRAGRAAITTLMSRARRRGVLRGDPDRLADEFAALLWGDLMMSLLLGTATIPSRREVARRARNAASAFLRLHA